MIIVAVTCLENENVINKSLELNAFAIPALFSFENSFSDNFST